MYKDQMITAIAANKQVRAFALTSRDLVEEARRAHGTSPVATAALGRTLSAALMMGSMLKNDDDVLTLVFRGDGPLASITATANHRGEVKGYVGEPLVDLPLKADGHLDVGGAVGQGTLTVIRDLDMKNTYNGQVQIHSGEIAEDIAYYFTESEQVPSSVGLGVLVDVDYTVRQAGGFIIQLMPNTEEETIVQLEKNIANLDSVTDMLEAGMTPEDMLHRVLDGFDVEITGEQPVAFQCDCSHDRVERALLLLGAAELEDIIKDGEAIELGCHFCGKKYNFTLDELKNLRAQLG